MPGPGETDLRQCNRTRPAPKLERLESRARSEKGSQRIGAKHAAEHFNKRHAGRHHPLKPVTGIAHIPDAVTPHGLEAWRRPEERRELTQLEPVGGVVVDQLKLGQPRE